MGPNVLVTSLLVFGALPSSPMTTVNTGEQKERIKLMEEAKSEAAQILAEQTVPTAMKANVHSTANVK